VRVPRIWGASRRRAEGEVGAVAAQACLEGVEVGAEPVALGDGLGMGTHGLGEGGERLGLLGALEEACGAFALRSDSLGEAGDTRRSES